MFFFKSGQILYVTGPLFAQDASLTKYNAFQNFTSKKEREPSDCALCAALSPFATRTVVSHFSHIRTNTKGFSKKRCISRHVRFHVINVDLSFQDHPDVCSERRKRNLSSGVCRQQQGKFC